MEINTALQTAIARLQRNDKDFTELDLSYHRIYRPKHIGDAGAKALADMLKVNARLTSLNLYYGQIRDAGAQALAEALNVNQSLTTLGLNLNSIEAAGAKDLAEALKVNRSLTWLDLNNNQIGDAGAQALAEMLKVNSSLTMLTLSRNQIEDAGAIALADMLKANQSLTWLDLNNNQIGDAGTAALAEMLKVNRSLTTLSLRINQIGDTGAAALADMLKVNQSLTTLGLTDNQIGDTGAAALAEMLKVNRSLTTLDLRGNQIGAPLSAEIAAAIKRNERLRDALHQAVKANQLDNVNTFIQQGVSLASQTGDEGGHTPLHWAMVNGHETMVRYLVQVMKDQGLSLLTRNYKGKTALDLAQNDSQRAWLDASPSIPEATQGLQALSLNAPSPGMKDKKTPLPAAPSLALKAEKTAPLLAAPVVQAPQPPTTTVPQTHLLLQVPYTELTLKHELGRGAFGIVYQGTWRYSEVAIKQLHLLNPAPDALEEFEREMALMAQLHSPHIVHLYAICKEPGHYGMVMEYAPKGSLYQVLHNPNETLPWPVRENIALGIAKGLAYLHLQQIIHRDLKSLNVLLDNQHQPKLTDFGLAKVKTATASTLTTSTKTVGTYAWMAPEILGLKPKYSPASDMYAYAIVVWELTSRKVPFEEARGDYHIIRSGVLAGEREDIPPETPSKLARLITWGWKAKPDERPQAAQAIELLASTEEPSPVTHPAAAPQYFSNLYSFK